jgi:hypothetical protein
MGDPFRRVFERFRNQVAAVYPAILLSSEKPRMLKDSKML